MACWEFLCYICVDFSFYTPLDLILRQAQGFGSLAAEKKSRDTLAAFQEMLRINAENMV